MGMAQKPNMRAIDIREVQWTTNVQPHGGLREGGPTKLYAVDERTMETEPRGSADHGLLEHIAKALTTARAILNQTCVGRAGFTIAPIQLMGGANAEGVIMSTSTFIALAEWNGRLAWVPTALLREQMSSSEISEFEEQAPYDMKIFVNRDCKFALSDPHCKFRYAKGDGDTYFSTVTVLVHELLHGMGFFSLGKDPSLLGNATHPNTIGSAWDNLLKDEHGGQFVAVARTVDGQQVEGTKVDLGGIAIFNPVPWQPGSSLSHFAATAGLPAVMTPSISTGTCAFRIPPHITSTLNLLGWACNLTGTATPLSWDHGILYSDTTNCDDCSTTIGNWDNTFLGVVLFCILCCICVLFQCSLDSRKQSDFGK